MRHQVREIEGVTVVELSGEFWGGVETEAASDHMRGLVAEGKLRFVIDLGKTTYLNSRGIGMLVALLTTLSRQGGKMVLARVTKRIHNVLVITRLNFIFDTFDTVEEAIASVRSWTPTKPAEPD